MVMEAEKSPDLWSANQPRRADGIVPIPNWLSRNSRKNCFSSSLKVRKDWCSSSSDQAILTIETASLFCSTQAFDRLDEAHLSWGGQAALFILSFQILISSRNTLLDTSRIMFDNISGHPVAQSCWCIELTIIAGISIGFVSVIKT